MRFPLIHILTTLLCLPGLIACGPTTAPPLVPEAEERSGESGSGDLEGTLEKTPNEVSPTDSLSATRLNALPPSLSSQVKQCEKNARFYNLGDKLCTDVKTASFPCRIDETFLELLDQSTWESVQTYVQTKAKNLQLYACTEKRDQIVLHFYNYNKGHIVYKELNVDKAIQVASNP